MRKMIFLMLSLLVLSTAGAKAQGTIKGVIIGGVSTTTPPHGSAVLDLQTNGSGNKGLLLPQVALTSDTDRSKIADPQNGMLVCNLTGTLARGVYYWSERTGPGTGKWIAYIKF